MNILFDNNVPAALRRHLVGHRVTLARQVGWHELSNGVLLKAAEDAGFPLMITGDKKLAYQQNLRNRKIALIVLGTTHWPSLQESLAPVLAAVARAKTNSFEQLPTPPYVPRKKVGS